MKSTRLVSEDMKICPGLDKEEYHEYREVIRYDLKNVRIITSPVERINSSKCLKWFRVSKNVPSAEKSSDSVLCSACKKLCNDLKHASKRISGTNQLASETHPSSHFSLKYLPPNSQKVWKTNTQVERSQDKWILRKYEPQDLVLVDSQHEMLYQH